MAGSMPYPQTRLEQVAQQARLTVAGFRQQYAATARRLADAGQGAPVTVSDRQVRRWFAGRLDGLPHLSAWVRGQQSVIAYWDDQPRAAAELAADGWQYTPESGTVRVWVAALEARARAKLRDQRATDEAFTRADQAREQVTGEDDPGGAFVFSSAAQHYYGSTARLWIGGQANYTEAQRLAATAVDLFEVDQPEQRQLGYLCTARVDLAFAHLGRDDLEGAATEIDRALAIATQRRSQPSIRRLRRFSNALERPRFQTTALALDLRDQIHAATSPPALSAGDA